MSPFNPVNGSTTYVDVPVGYTNLTVFATNLPPTVHAAGGTVCQTRLDSDAGGHE